MDEIVDFSEKLCACDFIALTPISQDRVYCRFYAKGLYFDRMFVSNTSLLEELTSLSKDEEVIEENSISCLKDKYNGSMKTQPVEAYSKAPVF
ncbi:hypothetical protein MKJ04_21060 [Pontibacter sp. E15-1]|uniref:hypothetical protein n=1 Tax=Pontibacter sp. E15-1 TaxID=2919918 RepID=UPI001F4F74C0|nr:hypothetical protein [Pontibacter sp. E15-1]MCJ8167344.1 hypothetical protein [Pontibacter sp. E15-1]